MSIGWAVNIQLLYFSVEFLGISAAAAGLIFAASRLYDAIVDPVVGLLSDRTTSRWGRRRPWIFASAIVLSVSGVALFNTPDFGVTGLTIYTLIFVLMFYTGYTMYAIPHVAMAAEMTDSYHERTSLMSYNVFYSALAGLIGTAGAAGLIQYFGSDRAAFGAMAWVIAALAFVALMTCFLSTGSARVIKRQETQAPSIKDWWQAIKSNRPFLLLISAKVLHLFGIATISTVIAFYTGTALGLGQMGVIIFGLGLNIGQMLALPLWTRAARYWSKQGIYATSVAFFAAVTLTFLLVEEGVPVWLFAVQTAALGFAAAGSYLMQFSLLPDVIAYDRALYGVPREGMFTAIFSFIQKSTQSLAPLLAGAILTYMGYVEGRAGEAQSEEAIQGVYFIVAVVPVIFFLAAIPILLKYDLTEDKIKAAGRTNVA